MQVRTLPELHQAERELWYCHEEHQCRDHQAERGWFSEYHVDSG
jgi:hypothetical protein